MIKNVDIKGVHTKIDDDLTKYIVKKVNKLDKFIPKKAKESAHAEVFIKESSSKEKKQYTCEIIIHLPKEIITTKETTLNTYAAVDIVEAKLKNQLKKYKEKHSVLRLHRKVLKKVLSRRIA